MPRFVKYRAECDKGKGCSVLLKKCSSSALPQNDMVDLETIKRGDMHGHYTSPKFSALHNAMLHKLCKRCYTNEEVGTIAAVRADLQYYIRHAAQYKRLLRKK